MDGNVVTFLWDSYVNYKKTGQTGEDINLSPFRDVVLSDYVLDELITIPISDTYKKHLCLLSIFPDLPVFKPITNFTKNELDNIDLKDLLESAVFISSVAAKRAMALVLPDSLKDLEQDIKNKEDGKIMAETFLERDNNGSIIYVKPIDRISIKDVISKIIKDHNLNPKYSAFDFYQLCMYLYVATRNRLINVPAKLRKGPRWMLNHQIDFYHLSYLPFVKGFATSDSYLYLITRNIIDFLKLDVKLYTKEEFLSEWIHK